ncbi:MAG: alkaline phosphatase family protein [Acetobacteraceae bacterium]
MGRSGINWGPEFPRFAADLTGDGKTDILGFGIDGVWVSLNDGKGNFSTPAFVPDNSSGQGQFGYAQGWRVEKHVRALGEFADPVRGTLANAPNTLNVKIAAAPGAGVAPAAAPAVAARSTATPVAVSSPFARIRGEDIVGFGNDGVWTALSQGDGTFTTGTLAVPNFGVNQGWQVGQHLRLLADVTGDGFADIVGFGDDGVWTALSNSLEAEAPRFVLANFGVKQGWTVASHPRILADLTGDKRTDIVGFGNDGVWTALSNGDGGFQAAKFVIADFGYNQGWRTDVHERLLADLTGDGKADFIGFGNDGVWTALSQGGGSFTPARMVVADFCASKGWRTTQHPRFVANLTGNRHADLIGFGNDGVWTALGNGDGTFAAPRFVLQNFGVHQGWSVTNHPRFLADTTGGGLPDIVGFGDAGVWTARNNGDGTFADARFVLNDFGFRSGQTGIRHIFVLMMENRSFDHFLGFSGIKGTDTETGQPSSAEVLTGHETNSNTDANAPQPTYKVDQSAGDTTVGQHDVLHQFSDVTVQLCGTEHLQLDGAPYPAVDNSGFVTDYAAFADKTNPGEPMRCFAQKYVPILSQLAREFVLCDHWYSSMAGPTEPNRMFAHAATSGVWDDSPSGDDQLKDEIFDSKGIHFDTGTLYDRLRGARIPFRIYSGDGVPNVVLLAGIGLSDVDLFEDFEKDVMDPGYDAAYTFIEPYYGTIDQYLKGLGSGVGNEAEKAAIEVLEKLLQEAGLLARPQPINSQHPGNSVFEGESLIKKVYEIIRGSPHWNDSMLILAWDEHGGFYDHVRPPRAAPTGSKGQKHGFLFDQYGPRVPAVVISPLCPQGMTEHRRLEHSAIPATVEQVFGLQAMAVRDSSIVGVQNLATLQTPRGNTPLTLTADSQRGRAPQPDAGSNKVLATINPSTLLDSINDPWLISTIFIVAKGHMEASATPEESTKIKIQVQGLRTVGDLMQYFSQAIPEVRKKQVEARQLRMVARNVTARAAKPTAGPAASGRVEKSGKP